MTEGGSYYFGGLSRSTKKGHDFVRDIVRPDHHILLESEGYHLDTVFTPVVSAENRLAALIVASDSLKPRSRARLRELKVPVIEVSAQDSTVSGDTLGDYAVNALVAPGVMVNSSRFSTPGVEERLKKMGIERYVSPLTSFKYAGGSVHCLTNEIF